MTDNEIRESWNFSKMVAINIGSVTLSKKDVLAIDDFINRQKAEIEKLTINMNAFGLGMKREKERADSAKADAVKEFAERLKVNILHNSYPLKFSAVGEIDNLVKEFTEGKND